MNSNLILVVVGVAVLLLLNEWWWRTHKVHNELGRKFIHITVGSFVAFWPWLLSWHQIEFLSLAFVAVVLISKTTGIFKAIHSVERPTWGELFFGLAVGAVALMTNSRDIYAVALLQMSLADGLAAIIGTAAGKRGRYKVLGGYKTIAGSLTFFVVSLTILVVYNVVAGAGLNPLFMIGLAGAASLIENLGARGSDNLLVPVVVVWLLGR